MTPFLPLALPIKELFNSKFTPDNRGQDYYAQIWRFHKPTADVEVIPGRHTLNDQQTLYCDPRDIISLEFYDLLASMDLIDDHTGAFFMFYHRPNGRPGPIHCDWGPDPSRPRNHWAINWCWALDHDQTMRWYEPVDPTVDSEGFPVTATRMNGWSRIPEYAPEAVREIAQTTIVEPTLVRTDIPHNAWNQSSHPRWAFSLRGRGTESWAAAVKAFQKYSREAERQSSNAA